MKKRVDKLMPEKFPIAYFHCDIDGHHAIMSALDIAYASLNCSKVSVGNMDHIEYERVSGKPDFKALDAAFEKMKERGQEHERNS